MQSSLKNFQRMIDLPERDWDLSIFQKPASGRLEDRFAVYANGFGIRSKEAMEEVFELFPTYVGAEKWDEMGALYIQSYPSSSYSLGDIGNLFPQFLKENSADEVWIELAEFELRVWKSFHAFDGPRKISRETLTKISENSYFDFQASMSLNSMSSSVAAAWLSRSNFKGEISKVSEYSVIYRTDDRVRARILEKREFYVLERLKSGMNLSDALGDIELKPEDLESWLHHWLRDLEYAL